MNTMLPIGSIVEVEKCKRKLVIIGYFHVSIKNGELFVSQYAGVDYLDGLNDSSTITYFDEEMIKNIYFIGLTIESNELIMEMFYEFFINIKSGMTFEEAADKVGDKYFSYNKNKYLEIKKEFFNKYSPNSLEQQVKENE